MEHQSDSSENGVAREGSQDDVWGDDDNVSYDRAIAEKEWSRMHETFGNTGYREGIEEGKEETLQQGFNQGWSEGVQYGHELGRLRGLISPLLQYVQSLSTERSATLCASKRISSEDLERWIQKATVIVKELVELDIAKVFDKAYFDDGRGSKKKPTEAIELTATSTTTIVAEQKDESGSPQQQQQQQQQDGCCAGSKNAQNAGSCCRGTTTATTTTSEEKELSAQEDNQGTTTTITTTTSSASKSAPESECCGGKGNGSCGASGKDKEIMDTLSALPSGLVALSSRPDQIVTEYRSRVIELLNVFQMNDLVSQA
ncbi:hypothetical protein BG004_002446 [Podila humilis]|nr:hypothetical protein BG004_002446 [Podila humilis]